MLCIRDKVWYRTDDLTESLWFLSLFCLQGQGNVGSGGHCNKLQERSAKVIVSIRSLLRHRQCTKTHSVSVSRDCWVLYVLGLHWISYFGPRLHGKPVLHCCALMWFYLNWVFNAFALKLDWCTLVQSTLAALVYPWCALKSWEPVWCAGARHTACTTVPPPLTTWAQLEDWTRRGLGGPWPPTPGLGGLTEGPL